MSEPVDLDGIEARASAVPEPLRGWAAHRNLSDIPNLVNFDGMSEADEASFAVVHTDASPSIPMLRSLTDHIAGMDPATALALVAEVRALRAKVEAVEAVAERLEWTLGEIGSDDSISAREVVAALDAAMSGRDAS